MPERGSTQFERAVSEGLKRLREEVGETQQSLARAARDLGLEWNRSTIAAIETGRRPLTFGEAVHVCFVLAWCHGDEIRLADLVPTGNTIALSDLFRVEADAVRTMLSGSPAPIREPYPARPGWGHQRNEVFGLADVEAEYVNSFHVDREVDERLARKLQVPYQRLLEVGKDLWGRPPSAELAHRRETSDIDPTLPERSQRAQLGHISRRVIAELEAALG